MSEVRSTGPSHSASDYSGSKQSLRANIQNLMASLPEESQAVKPIASIASKPARAATTSSSPAVPHKRWWQFWRR